ncbi:MAG: arsenate reductase family protein [Tissierellia bacterium]|nr:arsenate reductase family protein [Tissierellia bacterium]
MKFIGYPKCSTSRKAKAWLDDHHLAYTERHIVEEALSQEELTQLYRQSGLPLKRFFNTSGMKYRELGLKDKLKELSEEEQLALLSTDGMLVKRPILVDGEKVLVGFKEAQWAEALLHD